MGKYNRFFAKKMKTIEERNETGSMGKQRKCILSILLIIFLLFSTLLPVTGFAQSDQGYQFPKDLREAVVKRMMEARDNLLAENSYEVKAEQKKEELQAHNENSISLLNEPQYQANDLVRVIVQLDKEAVLAELKKSGKLLSNTSMNLLKTQSDQVINEQSTILSKVERISQFKVKHRFSLAVNGFSGEVRYGDIEKIKQIPGVRDVKIANQYFPDGISQDSPEMYFSAPLIGATNELWSTGYDGDNVIVAIVDTGVNYFHPAFGGTGKETLKLGGTKDRTGTTGYTLRVIGGYNWADGNDDIVDRTSSQHGVHVAGTVAGYDEHTTYEGKPFSGIAPKAKILAEKVFSNDPDRASTTSDEIIAAIEHAVTHGANVINMSLGSTAGAVTEDDPEIEAVNNAVASGVVVSISAGNSGYSSLGLPYAENPDVATLGSPSVSAGSISVAASENTAALFPYFTLSKAVSSDEVSNLKDVAMVVPSELPSPSILDGEYEIVYVGLGSTEDFAGVNVAGKVALIQRGEYSFSDKILNAAQAGAVAAIIFNSEGNSGYVSMAVNGYEGIPAGFILGEDGRAIKAALEKEKLTLHFGKNPKGFPLQGDTMTDFSSWGPEPGLNFKPTLTAPGGNIYSSVGHNEYDLMSGTSMAAPHVTGAAALVIDSFKTNNRYPNYSANDVKTALSNTAKILIDPAGNPYPVRQQGAGRIQVDQAVKTDVLVTSQSGEPGVTLKDFDSKTVTFTLTAKNIGDKAYTYQLAGQAYQDKIIAVNGRLYDTLSLSPIDAQFKFDKQTLTIPAKGSATVTVTITLPDDAALNRFVDGWITFEADEASGAPDLVVPFFGFYGDWGKPNVIDPHWASEDTYYGISGLYDWTDGFKLGLTYGENYDQEMVAFSPNGDLSQDQVLPVYSFLRNAETVKVNILNKNHQILKTISLINDKRKDVDTPYSYFGPWDGMVSGNVVDDGQYYIETVVKPYGSDEEQHVIYPIKVDTKNPSVIATLDNGVLSIDAADDASGIWGYYYEAYDANGKLINADPKSRFLTEDTRSKTIPGAKYVFMGTWDNAGNYVVSEVGENLPFIYGGADVDKEGAEAFLYWSVNDQVARIDVKVDNDTPQSLPITDYPNGVNIPLTYGNHTVWIGAYDAGGNLLSQVTDVAEDINALLLKTDNTITTTNDQSNIEIPFTVISWRATKAVLTDVYKSEPVDEIVLNLGETTDYTFTYNAPIGNTTLALEVLDEDNNLLGYDELSITNVKKYDVKFSKPYIVIDEIGTAPIDFNIYTDVVSSVYLGVYQEVYEGNLTLIHSEDLTVSKGVYTYQLDTSILPMLSQQYTVTIDAYDASHQYVGSDNAVLVYIPTGILKYVGDSGPVVTNQDSYTITWDYKDPTKVGDSLEMSVNVSGNHSQPQVGDKEATIDLTNVKDGEIVSVNLFAKDETGKILGQLYFAIQKDLSAPAWYIDAPAPFGVFNAKNNRGEIFAYTFDRDLDLASVTLAVPGMSAPRSVEPIDFYGIAYMVDEVVTFTKEGFQNIELKYRDQLGNEGYHYRKVFVDLTEPEIQLTSPKISLQLTSDEPGDKVYEGFLSTRASGVFLSGNVKDTFTSFDFFINDNQVLGLVPSKSFVDVIDQRSFNTAVSLQDGENTITLHAVDGAGNETTILLHVTKYSSTPPSNPPDTTPPNTTTLDTEAGKATITTNSDGTVLATVEISTEVVTDQINDQNVTTVAINLGSINLEEMDQLALTIDQETTKKLLESGKGITIQNNGVDIEIPAALLSSFVGADGTFTFTIKVEEAKKEEGVTVEAVSGATIVSPILSIGEAGTALKEPITLTLKLKDGAAKDVRKVGPYSRTTSGKWTYVGNLKDRHGNTFTVKTSTLGTFALIEYAKSFDDIANHWAKDAVEVMASQNIVKGSSANTFNPEGKVTRAEFATMLVRALGLSTKGAYTGQFTDVKEGDWFAGSVEAAAKAGIIQGSGGKFNPNASVNREEMTVMLIRALGMADQAAGLTPSFSDAGSIATWAKEAVALAQQKGLISGVGNNLFAPKGTSKRAEAATILFRLMETLQK